MFFSRESNCLTETHQRRCERHGILGEIFHQIKHDPDSLGFGTHQADTLVASSTSCDNIVESRDNAICRLGPLCEPCNRSRVLPLVQGVVRENIGLSTSLGIWSFIEVLCTIIISCHLYQLLNGIHTSFIALRTRHPVPAHISILEATFLIMFCVSATTPNDIVDKFPKSHWIYIRRRTLCHCTPEVRVRFIVGWMLHG